MNKNEKISVIIPIYNSEKYLNRCLNSIINQTYTDLEIILVDDGSTDNSLNICKQYGKIDKRIKIIHQENAGASVARNKGIENSTGNFISFIDSDDYVDCDMFSVLYNNINKYQSDISICGRSIEFDDNKKNTSKKENIKVMTNKEALIELNSLMSFDMSPCDKLYKIKLFENIKFPKVKKCEDFYIMYKLFYYSSNIVYDSTPLYHYCRRKGSNSNNNIDDSYINASKSQVEFFKKHCEDILYSAITMYAYANTIQYNIYIVNNIKCSNNELKRLKRNVKKNIKYVIKNKHFLLIRKIQIIIFAYITHLYYILIRFKYKR